MNLAPTRLNQNTQPASKPKTSNARQAVSNPAVPSDSFHSPRFSGTPTDSEKPSLINAVRTDDPAKLLEALDNGADIHEKYQESNLRKSFSRILGNDPQYNEMNALHVAVNRNKVNPECLQILLDKGININSKESETGWTALHRHMYQSRPNEEITKTLLAKGINVNAKDAKGKTALHELIDSRWTTKPKQSILKPLREHGADLHARDKSGRSPLDIIAEKSNPDLDTAQYLIRTGETQQEREMLKYNFLLKYQRTHRDEADGIFGITNQQGSEAYKATRDAINAISTKKLTGKDKLNFKHQPAISTPAASGAAQAEEVQEVQQPDNQTEVKPKQPAKKEESTSFWNRFLDKIAKLFNAFLDLFRTSKKQTDKQ